MDTNIIQVYLDNTLIHDLPNGIHELVLSIIRENEYSVNEQILRDNAESQLEFDGDGYSYICQKRKENFCEEILVSIGVVCENEEKIIFEGLINQNKVEIYPRKCIAKTTNIKDNSFSGLIRDYINVEVDLSNIRTLNCYEVEINSKKLNTPTTPNTYTIDNVRIFDVLDVLKFLIAYFTDNRITVKSDYLTNNLYAISTGYNLHNTINNNIQAFTRLSIEKLFTELRKKLCLYMAIEYDNNRTPYLRIEQVDYFYSNEQLFEIAELPLDLTEKLDENSLYNSIKIGSNTTELQDDKKPLPTMLQTWSDGWSKDEKTNCGGCHGEKDNTLDLVSDFIIDGNLIHEAMNQDEGADYDHDDKVFLLNYYYNGFENKLVGNNTSIYNINLNNYNTLKRWVGISNRCININEEKRFAFFIDETFNTSSPIANSNVLFIKGTNGYKCGSTRMDFINTTPSLIYDNSNSLYNDTAPPPPPHNVNCPERIKLAKYYKCAKEDIYRFKAQIDNFRCDWLSGAKPYNVTSKLHILVYEDDTFTVLKADYFDTKFSADGVNDIVNLELETPEISLQVGNTVILYVEAEMSYLDEFNDFNFFWNYTSFELLPSNCSTITDDTNQFKPFVSRFEYPLCLEDYLKAKQNKKGYILVAGQKMWIKELQYNHNDISVLQLIHKESNCECSS